MNGNSRASIFFFGAFSPRRGELLRNEIVSHPKVSILACDKFCPFKLLQMGHVLGLHGLFRWKSMRAGNLLRTFPSWKPHAFQARIIENRVLEVALVNVSNVLHLRLVTVEGIGIAEYFFVNSGFLVPSLVFVFALRSYLCVCLGRNQGAEFAFLV